MDLAYLALVSTKDEDEAASPALPSAPILQDTAQISTIGAETSDTVMTTEPESITIAASNEGLASAQPPATTDSQEASQPSDAGSPSVLGKRTNHHLESMDIERRGGTPPSSKATLNDDFVMVESQDTLVGSSPQEVHSTREDITMSSDSQQPIAQETVAESKSQDVALPAVNSDEDTIFVEDVYKLAPPPLPARPERKSTSIVNTNMMFGRQNDVSEAMDNGEEKRMYTCPVPSDLRRFFSDIPD